MCERLAVCPLRQAPAAGAAQRFSLSALGRLPFGDSLSGGCCPGAPTIKKLKLLDSFADVEFHDAEPIMRGGSLRSIGSASLQSDLFVNPYRLCRPSKLVWQWRVNIIL